MTTVNSLPQSASVHYKYHLFHEIEPTYFQNELPANTLCWVLLSRGKGKTPRLSSRARVIDKEEEGKDSSNKNSNGIKDVDIRVLVQYPKGSTYHVRRCNLMPVLETQQNLILVASETTDYRRMAIVHTQPQDVFLEIGCDFGILINSVDCRFALGVDKSETSINIAKQQYPDCYFHISDIFEDDNDDIQQLLPTDMKSHSLVVAIDINGNRELPAVVQCLQIIIDTWSPRIIVVKSRELFGKIKRETTTT